MSAAKSMLFPSSEDSALLTDINTTPLIDVLLVLLIMLIVTIPPMMHAVNMDVGDGGIGQARERIVVEIDFDGTVLWNDAPVSGIAQLESYLKEAAAKRMQPILQIKAHRRAHYDTVAKVLAATQRNEWHQVDWIDW